MVEVSNPYQPVLRDTWVNEDYIQLVEFAAVGNTLIVIFSEIFSNTEIKTFEISENGQLTEISSQEFLGTATCAAYDDNYLYVAFNYSYESSNIRVLDISDPGNPTLANYTDFMEVVFSIALEDENLYVSDFRDILIYDVSNTPDINEVAVCETESSIRSIEVSDDILYVCHTWDDYVNAYDLSNPLSPVWFDNILPVEPSYNLGFSNGNTFIVGGCYLTIMSIYENSVQNPSLLIPADFGINKIYPNPFNSTVTIEVDITSQCFMEARVFDLLGREVALLDRGLKVPGRYSINWHPQVATGVYFVRVANNFGWEETKSLVHLR